MVIPVPPSGGQGTTTAGEVAATAAGEVAEVTQDTVEEMGRLAQYIQDSIPKLAGFGVRVLVALAVFFIGRIVIRWIQKLVRRSLERSSADKGVEQFVDSPWAFCSSKSTLSLPSFSVNASLNPFVAESNASCSNNWQIPMVYFLDVEGDLPEEGSSSAPQAVRQTARAPAVKTDISFFLSFIKLLLLPP